MGRRRFAHLVHLDEKEVHILASTGTGMAHCLQSNCRLGSGVAPADAMARLGGAVSLGVDGAASVRLAGDRGFPGELEDALFQTVERWPNRIAADNVPPMWAQPFSEPAPQI
ncbi:amidohydrolase family protein [Bradyrhizobium barranii]|uniref:amidohydrolase family protein n=1 Tax=Bradyrhizobium TaxID=374 RepID=UPI00039F0C3D